MSNDCKHFVEPFSVQEPTASQIAQYKLDQCEICHKWFSFLGVCKEWHKRGIIEDMIIVNNWLKMPMSELEALVISTLKDNEHIVAQYLAGKQKAMNVLVGKVMEQAKPRADAKDVISILKTVCYGREL